MLLVLLMLINEGIQQDIKYDSVNTVIIGPPTEENEANLCECT